MAISEFDQLLIEVRARAYNAQCNLSDHVSAITTKLVEGKGRDVAHQFLKDLNAIKDKRELAIVIKNMIPTWIAPERIYKMSDAATDFILKYSFIMDEEGV